jgi:hypothetical protein
MSSILENIINSPFFSFISGIIVTAIFGFIFWRLTIETKKPVYTIKSFNLIQDFTSNLSKLSIKYNQKSIKNLTTSKIAFWNDGKKTIDKKDIITSPPLKIQSVDGVEILDKEIIFSTEPANMFKTFEIENFRCFRFTFDFMARDDSVVIQVIHTGKNSNDIFLTGKIKEVKEIEKRELKVVHRVRYISLPWNHKINVSDFLIWKGSAFRPPKKAHQMGTLKWSVKVQQIGTPFF